MASQGLTNAEASTRLSKMQMQFRQKQLAEREQRRIDMLAATKGSGDGINATTKDVNKTSRNIGNGKVRQMFDERRRGVGIDRGQPLKPISSSSTTSSTATTRTTNVTSPKRTTPTTTTATTIRRTTNSKSYSNLNGSNNHDTNNNDQVDNAKIRQGISTMSLNERRLSAGSTNYNNNINHNAVNNNNNNNHNGGDYSRGHSSSNLKLNPVIIKKTPPPPGTTTTTTTAQKRQSISSRSSGTVLSSKSTGLKNVVSPPKVTKSQTPMKAGGGDGGIGKSHAKTKKSSNSGANTVMANLAVKPPPRIVPPPEGMATCKICNRNFVAERLQKHEQVCAKLANTTRKVFNASKHRVAGTDAERFAKRTGKAAQNISVKRSNSTYMSAAALNHLQVPPNSGFKKNNWRKNHEEFIAAIRAAKQVQQHLARGGKLSDLPPPPPSENPDYIQCPHCMRRFNQAAAERHIPKCANMLHNKPKPNAPVKRR